ncbi:hypothetical protein FNB79_08140 [Formosa sediminum]|uniref:Rhamnosyl transferase n=1 Tax=Formosa sediminum TaxID=2594004 RepID=A0A516GR06_9FLAO|nr:glycosyltransferase [Formosa sediminum]QDO93955.1 hypothetical protein FNB79_08140 [Formosa sediminum]
MFEHFIITRFNLRKEEWQTNKNNIDVLTDEWHRNRFKLFTEFCVPCIANQTNKNFTWLVYFDSSTKQEFRTIISEIAAQLPNFKPFYIEGMPAFLPEIEKEISKCKTEYIITSRLDNDDCTANNYVESIQNKFNNQDFLALDFIKGYTLQISPSYRLGNRLQLFNPFLSLIEKNEKPITIWNSKKHGDWKRVKKLKQIKDEYIWASIIHYENKTNRFRGFGKVNLELFLETFNFSEDIKKTIRIELEPNNKWRVISFKNKFNSIWKYYYKKIKRKIRFYD